jgi:hypothetical protein
MPRVAGIRTLRGETLSPSVGAWGGGDFRPQRLHSIPSPFPQLRAELHQVSRACVDVSAAAPFPGPLPTPAGLRLPLAFPKGH